MSRPLSCHLPTSNPIKMSEGLLPGAPEVGLSRANQGSCSGTWDLGQREGQCLCWACTLVLSSGVQVRSQEPGARLGPG